MGSIKKNSILVLFAALAAAVVVLNGCGGGGGGTAATAPANQKSKSGSGKIAAVVKLTPPAGRAAASGYSTVTVTVSVSGIYAETDAAFEPVTTSAVIDISAGPTTLKALSVPVGVNHLITVVADWGGGTTETLMSIVPEIVEGSLTSSTVDHESTAVAEAALYDAEKDGKRLTDLSSEVIAKIQQGVTDLYKSGTPYYAMTPEAVFTFIANQGIPASVSLSPLAATVVKGQTLQFTGAQLDLNGVAISGAALTWSFDTAAAGSVSSSGLFTAAAEGSGILTVTSGSFTATTSVTVISNCTMDSHCDDGMPLTYDVCANPNTTSAACTHTAIACAADTDCNDSNALTIDACTNGGTLAAACTHTAVACLSDTDCNDSNALTIDACANPGTASAACSNTAFACNTNSDCSGGYPICVGGGTLTASCVACAVDLDCNDSNALTIDVCVTGAPDTGAPAPARVSGAVATYPYCDHQVIACNTDADCDDSNAYTTDACTYGGTAMALCTNTPIGPVAAAISIGDDHACAVQPDGSVQCWGYNYDGQIGYDNGQHMLARMAGKRTSTARRADRKSRSTTRTAPRGTAQRTAASVIDGSDYFLEPYTVTGITGATSITAKGSTSCALLGDGSVQCWGYNNDGQAGDASMMSGVYSPVAITGLSGMAIQIDNNYDNTCAVISGGALQCWGYNYYGQLGDGTQTSSGMPVTVQGLSGPVSQVAVGGDDFICALITDGTVQCWGHGGYGQLGDGNAMNSNTPVTVSGITNAVEISAGYDHACALLSDTTMVCWGANYDGNLGDGTQTQANSPVAVSGLSGVTTITAGSYHTCALITGGVAKCWGYNSYGELGVPPNINYNELLPVTVTKISGTITAISAGDYSTCFITSGGSYTCLGDNYYGQLGNGRGPFYTSPVSEFGLTGVTKISMFNSACALTSGGSLSCWGSNSFGQLGTGDTMPSEEPVTSTAYTSMVDFSLGSTHSCAIISGGTIACIGFNYAGQLGDGTYNSSLVPVAVSGLSGPATVVYASDRHSCAIISGGALQCWGGNDTGQLGDGTYNNSTVPITVSGLSGPVAAVAPSNNTTCALINDGTIQCWGQNIYGQLGDGTYNSSTVPVTVSGLSGPATAIATSYSESCALINDGSIQCWGLNTNGQLGDGTYNSSNVPLTVSGLSGPATAVAVTYNSVCALISDGTVQCWGTNIGGQLGDNSTNNSPTPVTVYGLTDATALYAGADRVCATSASRGLLCWGSDVYWYGY